MLPGNRLHLAGLAGCVLAPLVARMLLDYDYAADAALGVAMAAWWAAAWRLRGFSWMLWSATAGWFLSFTIGMVTPLWLMAWVALAPLYEAVDRSRNSWQAAACGCIAGFVASLVGLDWVLYGFAHYTGWGNLTAAAFFLPFCLVALWPLVLWSLAVYGMRILKMPLWAGLVPAAAFAVADWIPLKPSHIYFGYSQWPWKSLIQVVDITGMPGLAFLMGWSGFAVWQTARAVRERGLFRVERRVLVKAWGPLCGVFALVLVYGYWRGENVEEAIAQAGNQQISVAAVQANAPAYVPNDAVELKTALAKKIVRLGATAAQEMEDVDLIVYAESTAPMGFRHGYNPIFRTAYQVVARNSGAHVLVDNVGYSSGTKERPERFWREFLLVNPEGEIAAAYQKKRLVPVGESMPFETQAPWLREIFSVGRTFQPGRGPATVELNGAKVAPLVCVEALHEDLSREAARQGADLLVSPSNDGWFRSGKQARQHLWGAGFRAVENRLPFLRVANTGHSAAITAAGDFVGEVSPLSEPWTAAWRVPLVEIYSLFSRHGHWFAVACGGLMALSLSVAHFRERAGLNRSISDKSGIS